MSSIQTDFIKLFNNLDFDTHLEFNETTKEFTGNVPVKVNTQSGKDNWDISFAIIKEANKYLPLIYFAEIGCFIFPTAQGLKSIPVLKRRQIFLSITTSFNESYKAFFLGKDLMPKTKELVEIIKTKAELAHTVGMLETTREELALIKGMTHFIWSEGDE